MRNRLVHEYGDIDLPYKYRFEDCILDFLYIQCMV
ncbi:MAG: hypothetical protein HC930_10970 [Hydrococcus sp. SU_1_0]|nr:hypothetical protein [Hydrococcus sp. SU_1_0]